MSDEAVDAAAARVAQRHLEAELAACLPTSGYGYGPRRHLVGHHALNDRVLSALAELGILTEVVRPRLVGSAKGARSTPSRRKLRRDPELRGRAKELLERLLAEVTPWSSASSPKDGRCTGRTSSAEPSRRSTRFGYFDARQRERWRDRWAGALAEGQEDSPLAQDPVPEETYAAVDLLAVVPPVELRCEAPVRVTCAELYADCVSIAWQVVVPQAEWAPGEELGDVSMRRASRTLDRLRVVAISLTDNLGTTYRSVEARSDYPPRRRGRRLRSPPVGQCRRVSGPSIFEWTLHARVKAGREPWSRPISKEQRPSTTMNAGATHARPTGF